MLNDSSLFNDKDTYIQNNLNKIENKSQSRLSFLTNNLIMKYIVSDFSFI